MKRKFNFKQIVCLCLTVIMVLSTMVGCGGNNGSESDGKKKKLVVGIPQNTAVMDYEEVSFTKFVEESLNIELEFVTFSAGAEANNQLTLMCAGQEELPDVLVGFSSLGKRMMSQFGEDGFFIDLKELIDEYAPTFKSQMDKLGKEEQETIWNSMTSASDGNVYGMPLYSSCVMSDYMQNMMYINQDWLDAVGMQSPTNTTELLEVLKAFRDKDPNGNGKSDEIPMYRSNVWNYVINAFVYYDVNHPLNVTDGKVWSPVITNEYRQALIYLNNLYNEGLITDQSFSSSSTDMKAIISGEEDLATVGIWYGHPESDTNTYIATLDQYVSMNPLSDETGKGGYVAVRPNDLLLSGFITKDCEDTETAMRFLDFFYTDESVTRNRHGEKDVNWKYVEEKEENIFGGTSNIKFLGDKDIESARWGIHLPSIYTDENYLTIVDRSTERSTNSARLLKEQTQIMTTWKRPDQLTSNLEFTTDEDDELDSIDATLTSYALESLSLFITGDKDPNNDADWNKYVQTMEEYNLSKKVDIYQAAFDRKYK
jgi:putative aldouronate transport system substrate-binding protein